MKLYLENNQGQIELPKGRFTTGPYSRRTKFQQRYSQDGEINVADGRVESRTMKFKFQHTSGDIDQISEDGGTVTGNADQDKDEAYKTFISELMGFFRPEYAPFYLVDTDAKFGDGVRTELSFIEYDDDFDDGLYYRVSNSSLSLKCLSGHWEDYNVQTWENTDGLISGDTFNIYNDSDLESYPVYTFYALDDVQTVTLTNSENDQFFTYANTAFGPGSTLVIDTSGEEAKCELDGVETGFMLDEGSGMILLEPGVNNFTFESSGSCQLTVEYRSRFAV